MAQRYLSVSVNVDETYLMQYINSALANVADKCQKDIKVLEKNFAAFKENFASLTAEVSELRETSVAQLFAYVHEMRATMGRRRGHGGGGGGGDSVLCASTRSGQSPDRGGYDSPLHDTDDGSDDARLEAEIASLKETVAAMGERLDSVERRVGSIAEQQLPEEAARVNEEIDRFHAEFTELVKFLGLEYNTTYGGLIKDGLVTDSQYLLDVGTGLAEAGKRMGVIEGSMQKKCAKEELQSVVNDMVDLKGFCTTAVGQLDKQRQQLAKSVASLQDGIRDRFAEKVNWIDLDAWKQSVLDVMGKTRDATITAIESTKKLEGEFRCFQANLIQPASDGGKGSIDGHAHTVAVDSATDVVGSETTPVATQQQQHHHSAAAVAGLGGGTSPPSHSFGVIKTTPTTVVQGSAVSFAAASHKATPGTVSGGMHNRYTSYAEVIPPELMVVGDASGNHFQIGMGARRLSGDHTAKRRPHSAMAARPGESGRRPLF